MESTRWSASLVSPKETHWPIMEVLCTYVRENAPGKRRNRLRRIKHDQTADETQNRLKRIELRRHAYTRPPIFRLSSRSSADEIARYEREGQVLDLRQAQMFVRRTSAGRTFSCGEPLRVGAQSGESQRSLPQRGEPQRGEPQPGEPRRGGPQRGVPRRGEPQRGEPQRGEPQRGVPQWREPQRGGPQRGEPQQG